MRVFLSYSAADEEWGSKLRSKLVEAGLTVWDAEHEVLPGDDWALEIAEALKRSDAMVVLLSRHAAESKSVRREIEYALGSESFRGRLIPVVVRPTKRVPWILRKLPRVELKGDLARASREIVRLLREDSHVITPPARAASH